MQTAVKASPQAHLNSYCKLLQTNNLIHNNYLIGVVVLCRTHSLGYSDCPQRGPALQCSASSLGTSFTAVTWSAAKQSGSVCSFTGFCGRRMCVSFSTIVSTTPHLLFVPQRGPSHFFSNPLPALFPFRKNLPVIVSPSGTVLNSPAIISLSHIVPSFSAWGQRCLWPCLWT